MTKPNYTKPCPDNKHPGHKIHSIHPVTKREVHVCIACGWSKIWEPDRQKYTTADVLTPPLPETSQPKSRLKKTPVEDGICTECYFSIEPCEKHG